MRRDAEHRPGRVLPHFRRIAEQFGQIAERGPDQEADNISPLAEAREEQWDQDQNQRERRKGLAKERHDPGCRRHRPAEREDDFPPAVVPLTFYVEYLIHPYTHLKTDLARMLL